jgi:hypothetical protein
LRGAFSVCAHENRPKACAQRVKPGFCGGSPARNGGGFAKACEQAGDILQERKLN